MKIEGIKNILIKHCLAIALIIPSRYTLKIENEKKYLNTYRWCQSCFVFPIALQVNNMEEKVAGAKEGTTEQGKTIGLFLWVVVCYALLKNNHFPQFRKYNTILKGQKCSLQFYYNTNRQRDLETRPLYLAFLPGDHFIPIHFSKTAVATTGVD